MYITTVRNEWMRKNNSELKIVDIEPNDIVEQNPVNDEPSIDDEGDESSNDSDSDSDEH